MKATEFRVPGPEHLRPYLDGLAADGQRFNLALIFSCVDYDVAEVQRAFNAHHITICGCSTAGEVAGAELSAQTIVGLLLDLPAEAFTAWSPVNQSIYEQAQALGRLAADTYAEPQVLVLTGGLILEDGHMIDGEDVVRGINSGAGVELPISGGLAADDFKMNSTYVFDNASIATLGLSAIIFDAAHVKVESCATSGWEPIGIEQSITSATGNVLHSINDEPALEFFERYLGAMTTSGFEGKRASVVNSEYPIQIQRQSGTVLRAPAFPHPDGTSIVLCGGVKTGEKFRFSTAPGFRVVDETVGFFRERIAALPATPIAAVMMSCKGRHAAFGMMLEDEIADISAAFGVPMAGFLTYGEIGALPGEAPAMHNDTVCMITLTPTNPS